MKLKLCISRDIKLCEMPEHIRRRYKSTLRTCFSGHGVHLVFFERQETSIINDEVNARTICQRSCSAVASWVARERRRLSQSWWRTGRKTRKIFAHTAPENGVTREFGANATTEDCEKLGDKEMISRRSFAG